MSDVPGWSTIQLGEIADFRNGINFVRAETGPFVKVVGVGDFAAKEVIAGSSELQTIRINGKLTEADYLRAGDLLFVRSNGNKKLVGRCVLIQELGDGVTFSGFTIRARIFSEKVHAGFISKVMRSDLFTSYLRKEGGGSSISNLSQTALASYEFPLPPLPEQEKIAAIIQTWDEAIDKLDALLQSLRRLRNWLTSSVLTGRVRLTGSSGEWTSLPLSDVLHEHRAQSTGIEEVFSVSVHKGLVNQVEHLGRSFAAAKTAGYGLVRPGDIVYTKSPTGNFPLGIIKQSQATSDVIVSPLYGVYSPETHALGAILDAYFESPVRTANYLQPLVQKGAKNTISITNRRFLEGVLSLPRDAEEQQKIAAVLQSSSAEIHAIEQQRTALRRQKRGLMQQLLTGGVRVDVTKGNIDV